MAILTPDERASAALVMLPWRNLYPQPDALVSANNRAQAAHMYGNRMSPLITSLSVLQLPVDYQLAGDPPQKFRAAGRMLRHIFNE
jgi:hypothetical protein